MCNTHTYSGVDPGWTNLGFAKIRIDETGFPIILELGSMDPSKYGICGTVEYLRTKFGIFNSEYLCLERYVTYSGKENPASEQILMLTGAMLLAQGKDTEVFLRRAIDWKAPLCKYLVQTKGFRNPSPSRKLDKDFSMAAAECIFGTSSGILNDHQADAACLAYFPHIHKFR